MALLAKLGLKTREQRAWCLYDWGNSAFPTIMMTAVLPIYYADVLARDLPENVRTAYWGYTSAIAMTIIAIIGPILGAIGDHLSKKKAFIVAGTLLGMLASASMAFLQTGDWLWASGLFIAGNMGFAFAEIFYDSLLPFVANEDETSRVSTAGYAIGYLGGGLCLVLCLLLIQMPESFGLAGASQGVSISFVIVAFWWGFFTIPLLRHVPDPPMVASNKDRSFTGFFGPLQRNWATLKNLRQYKNAFLFLLAFWAYSDGIGTVIKMATIYGKEVGIGTSDLIGAIVMVQFLGVPFTFAFGPLADRWGRKPALCLTLAIYSCICVLAYFMDSAAEFWLLAFLVSMVQGAAQALSRSIFTSLVPREKSGEFFGFYSVSARFAGIFGPLIFGLLSQSLGSSRLSILAIVLLFIVGILLLLRVEIPHATAAQPKARYD